MKSIAILLVSAAALNAEPIPVTLSNPVSVDQPVTVIQPVQVSRVDVTRIVIDTTAKQITFQTTSNNSTITLSGAAYDSIAAAFRDQFAARIAPLIEAKLKSGNGGTRTDE